MEKKKAIEMLGGTVAIAARQLGTSKTAIYKWPPVLSSRVAQRVMGAASQRQAQAT